MSPSIFFLILTTSLSQIPIGQTWPTHNTTECHHTLTTHWFWAITCVNYVRLGTRTLPAGRICVYVTTGFDLAVTVSAHTHTKKVTRESSIVSSILWIDDPKFRRYWASGLGKMRSKHRMSLEKRQILGMSQILRNQILVCYFQIERTLNDFGIISWIVLCKGLPIRNILYVHDSSYIICF